MGNKILTDRNKKKIIYALVGGVAGFMYWRFVGCNSGSCPLTSNPYSTIFFFALGGLLLVSDKKREKEEVEIEKNK